jgi:DNA-binding response OmpR family regulator
MEYKKILLVEDDTSLGMLLMDYLETEHYQVTWKREGLSALDQLKKQPYDLCLLDISMPGMDGFSLARQIKHQFKNLPFLFITARSLKQDKIKAYELGAEDYIIKPFDADELACKMRVVLRRTPSGSAGKLPEKLELGKYTFYTSRQELCLDGKTNKLTEKESQILLLLCQQQNKILRREEAVTSVYGKFDYFLGRSFDVFISRLRKLLREDPDIQIDNVFKVGFIMRINSTIQI